MKLQRMKMTMTVMMMMMMKTELYFLSEHKILKYNPSPFMTWNYPTKLVHSTLICKYNITSAIFDFLRRVFTNFKCYNKPCFTCQVSLYFNCVFLYGHETTLLQYLFDDQIDPHHVGRWLIRSIVCLPRLQVQTDAQPPAPTPTPMAIFLKTRIAPKSLETYGVNPGPEVG